jgi:hypothetical protein
MDGPRRALSSSSRAIASALTPRARLLLVNEKDRYVMERMKG